MNDQVNQTFQVFVNSYFCMPDSSFASCGGLLQQILIMSS